MIRCCRVLYVAEPYDYVQAYILQKKLVHRRIAGEIPDTLLLLSHPPVYTIGRQGAREHILAPEELLERAGIKVYETDRGGAVTYHGPGQLVGYPILHLKQHGCDLHKLLYMYEEVFIRLLTEYGVQAGRLNGYPGVWTEQGKICSLGVGVSKWVSYHGWAFNINPSLEHFSLIIPCGIRDKGVTSLAVLLDRDVPEREIAVTAAKHFGAVFKMEINE